ncbi:MAG: hypothetical protein ABFS41_06895 [Myxococcota bacterium]
MAPASDTGITRRQLLRLGAGAALLWAWPRGVAAKQLGPEVEGLLEKSGFVYVSPLRAGGAESRCHGEVWYGWFDGSVVLITSKDSWKAHALSRGLGTARIWVGDHGRVGGMTGSEKFRQAPSFDAKARATKDAELLDRLMELYRKKYPDEIGRWESKMRSGFESGERVLIRYEPL